MRKIVLTAILLLFLLFPLVDSINYIQADEWDWYSTVERYLKGDFSRNTRTAANFYLQGFMAMPFSYLFGIQKLPVLTLLISIINFIIFGLTLDLILKDKRKVLILSLLYFLIPLNVYSIFGFMTENYFQLFFLISIYFIVKYNIKSNQRDFYLANLFIILGYFIRQFSIITSLAFLVSLLIKAKWNKAIVQAAFFIGLVIYHLFLLPKTTTMFEDMIKPNLLFDFQRTFSLIVIFLIYISIFLFPIIFLNIIGYVKNNLNIKNILLIVIASSITLWFITANFKPDKVEYYFPAKKGVVVNFLNGEFPYLDSIFKSNGFYPDLPGNSYDLKYFFDTFRYWEKVAFVLIPIILVTILLKLRNWIDFYSIFIFLFIGVLFVSPLVYDRYLIPLFPIVILLIVTKIKNLSLKYYLIILPFLLFLSFLNYQYSMEMVQRQNLVWAESNRIVNEFNEDRKNISSNHAWKMLYHEGNKTFNYYFHYDSPEIFNSDLQGFELIKTYDNNFPLSLYSSSKIYLYKKTEN